jgi:hypothetical protein
MASILFLSQQPPKQQQYRQVPKQQQQKQKEAKNRAITINHTHQAKPQPQHTVW